MKAIRIGLIGCGTITVKTHIPALMNNPAGKLSAYCFQITCICGLDLENIEYIKTILPHVSIYHDYQELIESGLCDAVIIATGEELHPRITMQAVHKNLFVMCEKPFAADLKSINEVLETLPVEMINRIQIGFNKRFYPVFLDYLQCQQEQKFGEPIAGWFYFVTQQGRKPGWPGILSNLIHHCDLICAMLGEIETVTGFEKRNPTPNGDSYSFSVSMKSKQGAVVSMFFSTAGAWGAPSHEEWQLMDGSRNRIICRNSNEFSLFTGNSNIQQYKSNSNSIFWLPNVSGYQSQLKAFYDLCTGETKAANPSVWSAKMAHELFDKIKSSVLSDDKSEGKNA